MVPETPTMITFVLGLRSDHLCATQLIVPYLFLCLRVARGALSGDGWDVGSGEVGEIGTIQSTACGIF